MCYIHLNFTTMIAKDEPQLGWLLARRDGLSSSALFSKWPKPELVNLHGSDLEFVMPSEQDQYKLIRPPGDIFDQFLNLGGSSNEDLRRFASRYGGLEIFHATRTGVLNSWSEPCDIWRYTSKAMRSLLRITAAIGKGDRPAAGDWDAIGNLPVVIREWSSPDPIAGRVLPSRTRGPIFDAESQWKALAYYIGKGSDRNRLSVVRLINALLYLGRVQARFEWPASSRPQIAYTSPSLLSCLALQLSLRASRIDDFAVCHHCHMQYIPPNRAPKAGQRSFCPPCRDKGAPKLYGNRDRRKRIRGEE